MPTEIPIYLKETNINDNTVARNLVIKAGGCVVTISSTYSETLAMDVRTTE